VILREAGFGQDRKDGTNVYFALRQDMPDEARELFKSLQPRLEQLPESKQDRARLQDCRRRRLNRSQNYFESLAGDWERVRKSYFDDRVASLAIEKLLPSNLVIADIGCGTGSLTFELARFARRVIGIDQSPEMLRHARKVAQSTEIGNVEFRPGDALKLPLERRSVDAAFSVMVLHFLPDPEGAIAELCRITRPGGIVVVLDLVAHNQEWMREQMAHRWLGFEQTAIENWFRQARVTDVDYELTGAYAGEKMARNGNRPVEIFIARAALPIASRNSRPKRVAK
jgi:ArsR family transcriptional regulator